ncbi:hypothetical protein DFJ74DRAFT_738744 [Hyaloraphidium curvatum]|nr:hypothetical protein DFJ74DRAFT_738744 [Hyaloraphidium curvatum]
MTGPAHEGGGADARDGDAAEDAGGPGGGRDAGEARRGAGGGGGDGPPSDGGPRGAEGHSGAPAHANGDPRDAPAGAGAAQPPGEPAAGTPPDEAIPAGALAAAPEAPRGPPPGLRPVSVFSLNCYLIPAFFLEHYTKGGAAGEPAYDLASCRDQAVRAARIGAAVRSRRPHLVALQEAWGGASDVLLAALEAPGGDPCEVVLGRPWGFGGWLAGSTLADMINAAWATVCRYGGLMSAVRRPPRTWLETLTLGWAGVPDSLEPRLRVLRSHHHTFRHAEGEEFMNKSVSFLLLDASSFWGPNHRLLALNTHLHSPDPFIKSPHRTVQIAEIKSVLCDLRARWRSLFISLSPDHPDPDEAEAASWRRTAVILCGDLNISYLSEPSAHIAARGEGGPLRPSEEYLDLLAALDARDLYLPPHHAEHLLRTFSYDPARNPYVAERYRASNEMARMDFLLALDRLPSPPAPGGDADPLDRAEAQPAAAGLELLRLDGAVEVLDAPGGGEGVLSDHWAVAAEVWPAGR